MINDQSTKNIILMQKGPKVTLSIAYCLLPIAYCLKNTIFAAD